LVVVTSLVGVGNVFLVIFWNQGPLRTSRIDDRFIGVVLPRGARAGFLTDVPTHGDWARYYLDAAYALAPNLLLPGDGERLVVANLRDPAQLESVCSRWRLRVVARGGSGVALLEHE
jgi:hypothetical protein